MKIIWTTLLLLIQSYRIIDSQLHDEYSQYSFYQKRPLSPRPLDAMADLTNDLGVNVLRVIAAGGAIGNVAFSPFGLMAVSVLLYEGSSGYSALQIKQSLNLPWEILAVRIGVRDLNRYLKTYFKSDGFLNGVTMSREEVCLRPQFKQVLRIYGFDDPNNFLVDSCSQSAMTTLKPVPPMSVTTHGTVITEMTPTSQMIQVSTNITNASASDVVMVATDRPAKVTYLGDATFTISNIDVNTNQPMKSQTDMMVVDIDTQPNLRPIESSTNQVETTVLIKKLSPEPSGEVEVTEKPAPKKSFTATNVVTESSTLVASDDPMTAVAATVTQMSLSNHNYVTNPQFAEITETRNNSGEPSLADPVDISTKNFYESTTTADDPLYTSITEHVLDIVNPRTVLPSDLSVASTKNVPHVTTVAFTDDTRDTTAVDQFGSIIDVRMDPKIIDDADNGKYVLVKNMTETNEITTDDYKMTDSNLFGFEVDSTTAPITLESNYGDRSNITPFEVTSTSAIPTSAVVDKSALSVKSGFNNDDDINTTAGTTIVDENVMTTTDVVLSTTPNVYNTTENEIIKEAESKQHYEIASLENKSARSMESNDSLPTFNIEFVVRKEDLRAGCNHTGKKTIIKPDRILTEYPKNSGVSITLRKSKERRKRHLEQYREFNSNRDQWYNGHKNYGSFWPGWIDRLSEDQIFESTNLFNSAGYRRIPIFTYTAVLPFGYIFELKSQVIEIPLDDPKYTLMILMPNHRDGLSELLLLLPTIPLRFIHNSLKPTAVHATIPAFKYTAKVDLTSALQQIGIQDVFYRYRADLSFMSPDARLFVSSVQQVVSVTAKKYNTPPVYEIQRKYVERDFVVSRPFVYFVMDIHTKVSLIAGVITDPLASPIWI